MKVLKRSKKNKNARTGKLLEQHDYVFLIDNLRDRKKRPIKP